MKIGDKVTWTENELNFEGHIVMAKPCCDSECLGKEATMVITHVMKPGDDRDAIAKSIWTGKYARVCITSLTLIPQENWL